MTAITDKGAVIALGKKRYLELGLDLDGDQRLGAWQIKEVVDLTLPPLKTTTERFVQELPPDTKSAELEVKLTFFPSEPGGDALDIYKMVKIITFEK